jgi:pimeloyl-ACP methyl ester carboxylesterase
MGSRDSTVTDAQLRAAEGRLLEHLGLTATERMITVPACRTGGPAGRGGPGEVAVRLLELGPGDGSPPVLFLHGIASASAAAFPLMRALSGRRVLALDWPGHGLSGECVLPANTDIRQHVRAVLGGVLAELGVSAVDLVGHSLGGQFGLFFTIAEPGAVRRLVLLGAPGGAFPQMRPVAAMRALAVPGAGGLLLRLPASRQQYRRTTEITLGRGVLDRWPADLAETGYLAARRPGFAPSVTSFFRCLATPAGVRPRVTVPEYDLAGIDTPVLLLWGDRDVFLTPGGAAGPVGALRDARLITVRGGHAPWLDDPQTCERELAGFLAPEPGAGPDPATTLIPTEGTA